MNNNLIDQFQQEKKKEKGKEKLKQIKVLSIKLWLIKNKWRILGFIVLIFLVFFPTEIGTAIGDWVDKFVGSIVNNINI